MKHIITPTRRNFIKTLAVANGAVFFPNILIAQTPGLPASKKIGMAGIGCDGKGSSDIDNSADANEIIAICDVDAGRAARKAKKFPNAKIYTDFREMLDKEKSIEAVTVSTPDHTHYPAAMHAIATGRHVCVQKPLVNTIWEAQQLHLAAKKKGVITQMGNQGHTFEETRVMREWLQAGVIGKVKEIHVWTNRPIWPQGKDAVLKPGDCPADLDWKLWLSSTPDIPYAPNVHNFKWRGFLEYGCGAIGDMGCHMLDPIVWGLGLGLPDEISTEVENLTEVAWPSGGVIHYLFKNVPGHGDIKVHWYEGKRADGKQWKPEVFTGKQGDLAETGFYLVGSDGILSNEGDQAKKLTIYPDERSKSFLAAPPAKTLPRSPAAGDPQREWSQAIKNGKAFDFQAQFDYSVPLTKIALLGALSMRAGKKINWDDKKFSTGDAAADKFIKRAVYRAGWEYSAAKI